MEIFVVGEGISEKKVCDQLEKIIGIKLKYSLAGGNGKKGVNQKASNIVSPLLQEEESVSCLLMYDLDSHNNETEADILKSIYGNTGWLKKIESCKEIDFNSAVIHNSIYPNLHTLSIPELKLNIAIHIATKKWRKGFIKSAIDDYVLELALIPTTMNSILAEINKSKINIHIPSIKIFDKVTKEIPDLMQSNANGIDDLIEAKDYLGFYGAVLKLHTPPPNVIEKIMAHADEKDIREVFGALIAAFEFVGGE
ncbi:hypothetical protein VB711_08900 [Cronbergia sp. UHCC 0137]|uniref:hypothetical protein n=1 Tax=Cronbergia sp. UHCC 0137 TaxID=3110239 RepID=UPI002B20325D|nr:hypothetical protein [Cronbergia sp. UHCC 0137]MEA5617955.1 hypothetical protein [Cronbergia sp. UHCC 0137]